MNADNIITEADHEITQHPERPTVPHGIPLAQTVTDLLAQWEDAHAEWVTADAAHVEAVENYRTAEHADRTALVDAARTAQKKAPPATAPDLVREIEFATLRAAHTRTEATRLAHEVTTALNNDPNLIIEITHQIEQAATVYRVAVDHIQQQWRSANHEYALYLRNLTFLHDRVRHVINFDPRHAHHSVPDIAWPQNIDGRLNSTRELMRRIREITGND